MKKCAPKSYVSQVEVVTKAGSGEASIEVSSKHEVALFARAAAAASQQLRCNVSHWA